MDASQNNVTIYFSGFTFTDPAYMAYEYQMEGVDKDWRVLTGKSEVTSMVYLVTALAAPGTGEILSPKHCLRIHMQISVNWYWLWNLLWR